MSGLKKQTYFPTLGTDAQIIQLHSLGREAPQGISVKGKKSWLQQRVFHDPHFMLQVLRAFPARDNQVLVSQQDYIKCLFHLSGECMVVLDGFGEYHLDRPQVLITACPEDRIKVNCNKGGVPQRLVSLCLRRDFFARHMELDPEILPPPFRAIVAPLHLDFAVHTVPLSPAMTLAVQGLLSGCDSPSLYPLYCQSKAIELMCLLIAQAEQACTQQLLTTKLRPHTRERLDAARDYLDHHYAEPLTLQQLARAVGINKTSLTSGFYQVFGRSVFEHITQQRMARAYHLLSEAELSIERVAEAVGYAHGCSFSTAFNRFYGCSPKSVRAISQ